MTGVPYAYEAINEMAKAAADRRRAAEIGEMPARRFINKLTEEIEADPFNAQTAHLYFSRGGSFAHLLEFGQAIADYSRAVQIKPDYVDAYYERSQIYRRLNQIEKAAAARQHLRGG